MTWNLFKRKIRRRSRSKNAEIAPDEIFLDASNLPAFDRDQFEGRIERPISQRTLVWCAAAFVLVAVILSGKLWMLQVVEGDEHARMSEENRLEHELIFAGRGIIYDREGEALVENESADDRDFSLRNYTDRAGLAHVLGYVNYPKKDSSGWYYQENFIGKAGVEASLDNALAGTAGLRLIETDARGNVRSASTLEPPQAGENVTLSIDAQVQEALHRAIADVARGRGFTGGAGVVMDVENGELLALTSVPEYDPTVLSLGAPAEEVARYVADEAKPFLNRAVAGLYAPGSIVKPFLAVAALEEGIITPQKEIESTGAISIPNPYFPDKPTVFRDWKAHGWTDMREALAVSSDVYFYAIGGGLKESDGYPPQEGLGIARIDEYMSRFGFGEPTGIALESDAAGVIPTPEWKAEQFDGEDWLLGNTYHTAIGQFGFQVTPLQAARATAALANGGTLLTPTLEKNAAADGINLVLDEENVRTAREGMRLAVTSGTAAGVSFPGLAIAAKTGTAEVGPRNEFRNSWIIGFFPADEPRFAFAIVMERGPGTNNIGAPSVAHNFFTWLLDNAPQYADSTGGEAR